MQNYCYNEKEAELSVNTPYCTVNVSANPMTCCDNYAQ